jgi:hypothetical protein
MGLKPLQDFKRLAEAQMFDLLDEIDGVAMRAAAEAVEVALIGIDRERWAMIIVKRAEAD